jgi:hypothetical protein
VLAASLVASLLKHFPSLGPNLGSFKATGSFVRSFRRRHKAEITRRKQEFVEHARAANMNRQLMDQEIATRCLAMGEVNRLSGGPGIPELVAARNKFNCDETGFSNKGEGEAVIAPAGERDCRDVGEEHGEHVSALLLVGADGFAGEPFFVMKGTRATKKYLTAVGKLYGVGEGCDFAMASKANMNTTVSDTVPPIDTMMAS